jgi:hypothetical protein
VSIQAFAVRVLDPDSPGQFPRAAGAHRFSRAATESLVDALERIEGFLRGRAHGASFVLIVAVISGINTSGPKP